VEVPPIEEKELSEHLKEAHLNAARNQTMKTDLNKLNEQLMKEYEKERLRELNGEEPNGEMES
jgi:hypothetical protein